VSIHFDRETYFDSVRHTLFGGSMTEGQVMGQEALLLAWETREPSADLRHAACALANAKHETANEMLPIREFGLGQGQPYGVPDPQTGQTYYGRGFVQLTWRENYSFATSRLKLGGSDDLEWHADRALDPKIAAAVLYAGMLEGWFRPPNALPLFFNENADDAYGSREIVNGDKHIIPSWSNGVSIGKLIAGYHAHFLEALTISSQPKKTLAEVFKIELTVPEGVNVTVVINGVPLFATEED
jgi:putative chitinase